MNSAQKRRSDAYAFVLSALELLLPKAMKEHREYKKQALKTNHRYWEIKTPYDEE